MTTRLPGVYFETVVPPVTSPLPRMDIAAFVGFAPSGPLDVPVAIEDANRFLEIYGQDQTLAWDPVAGEMVYAQMPPSVRAFFRNGGERCWVVRVADDSAAVSNQFMLTGTLLATPSLPLQAGWLVARSEGSWSDDYNVNATLSFGPIEAGPPQNTASGISIVLYPNTVTSVAAGDLLQISFDPPTGSPSSLVTPILFLPVSSVSSTNQVGPSGAVEQTITAVGTQGYWFQPATVEDFTQLPSSPPIEWLAVPQTVTWLTQPQNTELWIARWGIETATNPPTFVLDGLYSQAEDITAGSWLLVQFAQTELPPGATSLLLLVDSVRGSTATAPASPGSRQQGDQETVQIVVNGAWWVLNDNAGWNQNLAAPRVDVVTLQLWVQDNTGQVTTLSNLGLTPLHPRYVGYLPTDEQLYAQTDQPSAPPWSDLLNDIDPPRFALAAPNADASATNTTGVSAPPLPFYLPLGVPGMVDADFYQPAVLQTAPALQRDGLVLPNGQITSSLFLDPDLATATVDTLLTAAFHKQYQLQRGDSPAPGEPLLKMHAILPIHEVSLLALPDAMHPGWAPARVTPGGSLTAPNLMSITEPSPQAQITASFTPVAGAVSYTLQQSGNPQFGSPTVVWTGSGAPDSLNPVLLQSGSFPQPSGCPSLAYFRVCAANQSGITGPWSNTISQTLPIEAFAQYNPQTLEPPVLEMLPESRGRVVLQWPVSPPNGDSFEVQLAYEPAFALPEVLFQGNDTYFEVWSDPSRTAYFRVGATRGNETSPWSNTVVAQSSQEYPPLYWMNPPPAPGNAASSSSELLNIHQAMIRLCAARADMFAFLGLPRSYNASTCVLYQTLLTTQLAPENGDTTLSFAAIYFPWLVVLDASDDQQGAIRSITPEGPMLGAVAALTLSSGAWFSPGNQLMQGVVDLDTQLGDQAPMLFFNNQLNLAVQEATGFLTMSSFTLSPWSQLAEINVRRLLILVRRLALREGMTYVFQPNDTTLWRRVQRRFEDVLSNLFLQGAFAGATQSESFLVTTDGSVNTPDTIAQGQFIVEINIAPSLPLEFLTVRLLQEGGDLTLTEES